MFRKIFHSISLCLLFTPFLILPARAQNTAVVAPASDAADGLDLRAVGELFRNSRNAEDLERALNDPEVGVNNLDLDDNGEVDYIRVLTEDSADTRVLILQVALSETEYQDVATIEVEKSAREKYVVQLHGNEQIYGVNYYVRPVGFTFATVVILGWLYSPHYHPWHSPFYFGHYPGYWRPYHPVHIDIYRTRTVHIHHGVRYKVVHTSRVTSANRVYVHPKSSVLVRKSLKNPTTAQREYQVRSRTKTVSSGGFSKSRTQTTVEGSRGGEVKRKKTEVNGPRGGEVKRVETTATTSEGGTVTRKKTKVTGPRGKEVKKVNTQGTTASGTTVKRTKTKATSTKKAKKKSKTKTVRKTKTKKKKKDN